MSKYQKILLLLLSLIILFTFIQMFGKAYRVHGYDFTTYLLASSAFFHGDSPYTLDLHFPYLYPLFSCIYLALFCLMPYSLANAAWFMLNISSLFYALFIVQKYILPEKSFAQKITLSAITFLALLTIARNNLLNGQINFIVLALCCIFFVASLEKRNLLSSIALSAAIATKLSPLLFIFYLLWNKQYKIFFLSLFFSFLFSICLPMLIVGPEKVLIFYEQLYGSLQQEATKTHAHHIVLSLASVLNDVFHIHALSVSFVIGFIMLFFFQREITSPIATFSLYLLMILLISPISETHHLANFFIPILLLISNAVPFQANKMQSILLASTLVLIWIGSSFVLGFFMAILLIILPFRITLCYRKKYEHSIS